MNEHEIPIGFDEVPPEEANQFPVYNDVPKSICPPRTNGGWIRALDNHQLAKWLAETAACIAERRKPGLWTEEAFLNWLNQPNQKG